MLETLDMLVTAAGAGMALLVTLWAADGVLFRRRAAVIPPRPLAERWRKSCRLNGVIGLLITVAWGLQALRLSFDAPPWMPEWLVAPAVLAAAAGAIAGLVVAGHWLAVLRAARRESGEGNDDAG